MLSLLLVAIAICGLLIGVTIKSYFNHITELKKLEIIKEREKREQKEKEELKEREERDRKERLEREERDRKERLEREERDRKERLDKEERDKKEREEQADTEWLHKLQMENIQRSERIDLQHYKDDFAINHISGTLSYDEVLNTINSLIVRVWTYEEHYYLKANDITIPRIEEESRTFGGKVLYYMSREFRRQAMLYFSMEGLIFYINSTFNDLIWKYATDRNELQGLYQVLYSKNRENLKRDLAKLREEQKVERLKNKNNKNSKNSSGNSGGNGFY